MQKYTYFSILQNIIFSCRKKCLLLRAEMKVLPKIAIAFSVLILLTFGTGGIGVAKCNCTGKTTLVLPIERGCCPMESDCMSITVAHISEFEVQHLIDTPQPIVVSYCQVFWHQDVWINRLAKAQKVKALDYPPPPTDIVGTTVLRV